MKREYQINIVLNQLECTPESILDVVEIFEKSILSIPLYDYDLGLFKKLLMKLDAIGLTQQINRQGNSSTARFFQLLLKQKNDISQEIFVEIENFIKTTPIDKETYNCILEFNYDFEAEYINYSILSYYNIALIFRFIRKLDINSIVRVINEKSKILKIIIDVFKTKDIKGDITEFLCLLKPIIFILKHGERYLKNKGELNILDNELLLSDLCTLFLNTDIDVSDIYTIRAILELKCRVNALQIQIDDIFLVSEKQLYNLTKEQRRELYNCNAEFFCPICSKLRLGILDADKYFDSNNLRDTHVAYADEMMISNKYSELCYLLKHFEYLRVDKYYKFILKYVLSHSVDPYILSFFKITDEVEKTSLSFLKSIYNRLETGKTDNGHILKIIPHFIKTRKLVFASFTILLKIYKHGSSSTLRVDKYSAIIAQNIVQSNLQVFNSILDLIVSYITNNSYVTKVNIIEVFSDVSGLFLRDVLSDKFVIYNSIDSTKIEPSLLEDNYSVIMAKSILDSNFDGIANDVDTFVEILFREKNLLKETLNKYFKPNISYFIRTNLSHIMFKLKIFYKNILSGSIIFPGFVMHKNENSFIYPNNDSLDINSSFYGNYNIYNCIFNIIQFILSDLSLSLYFNYIWQYLEYFINEQDCCCKYDLLEYISRNLTPEWVYIISPYLDIKYEEVENIPMHVESMVFPLLKRHFKPFEFNTEANEQFITANLCSIYNKLLRLFPEYNSNKNSRIYERINPNYKMKLDLLKNERLEYKQLVNYMSHQHLSPNNSDYERDNNELFEGNHKNESMINRSNLSSIFYKYLISQYPEIKFKNDKEYSYLSSHNYIEKDHLNNGFKSIISQSENKNIKMKDGTFISAFLYYYTSSKVFRHKILNNYSNFNLNLQSLTGYLTNEVSMSCNSNIPTNICIFTYLLETHLLKIDFQKQELYSFTIQEFLKVINQPLARETEIIVEQFRNTKLSYKFDMEDYKCDKIDFTGYRKFLETFFYLVYCEYSNQLTNYHLPIKYLILLNETVLESAIILLVMNLKNKDDVINQILFVKDKFNNEMKKFILKMNKNVTVIDTDLCFIYSLGISDFYGVIYNLEKTRSNKYDDILQLSYYMINDVDRVKGFMQLCKTEICMNLEETNKNTDLCNNDENMNVKQNTASKSESSNILVLFFNFLLSRNYKAANECYLKYKRTSNPNVMITNIITNILRGKLNHSDNKIFDFEEINSKKLLHIMKDIELISDGYIELVNQRRMVSIDPEGILNAHKEILDGMAEEINIMKREYPSSNINEDKCNDGDINDNSSTEFLRYVNYELTKLLRIKKEYFKCEELIAKLVLNGDNRGLYQLALIKIDQKHTNEAKEIIKRYLTVATDTLEYYKGYYKLFEISRTTFLFNNTVKELEDLFYMQISNDNIKQTKIIRIKNVQQENVSSKNGTQGAKNISQTNKYSNFDKYKMIYDCIINKYGGSKSVETPSLTTNSSVNGLSNNIEYINKTFNYLRRIYFLSAKYFEKTDITSSLLFYLKSFNSNYEAIPRFFHNIQHIPKIHSKILSDMIDFVLKNHIPDLYPYYNQICTKVLENSARRVVQAMMEHSPYKTFWNSLILFNSRKQEIKAKMDEIIEELSFEKRVLFQSIVQFSQKLTNIAICNSKELKMKYFPEVTEFIKGGVSEGRDQKMSSDSRILYSGDDLVAKNISASDNTRINIPGTLIRLNSFKDDIYVFKSLQMPKKITFVGDDGILYPMIVKSKDDLRKDSRFMDMNTLLNKLFKDDIYIRRYNIIPFTHDSGILEFIPNLLSLKDIITKYYDNLGEGIYRFRKYKKIGGNNMSQMISDYPPVFNSYLTTNFSDPFLYYKSRENYIKTYATMCIVGWYMGLGDRHTENIHFDTNGDTVHVDLNCIFDKAKQLEIPETVPFRLTQNIIDGCGRLGVEGTFKNTMKYVLMVLKDNQDAIQANLLSFVFDPLFEWARKKNESTRIMEGRTSKMCFDDEDEKVEELINEATDINNLGALYIGWMSFL